MKSRSALFILSIVWSVVATAQPATADSAVLREVVRQFVQDELALEGNSDKAATISVSNLDRRLGLSPCDGELSTATTARRPLGSNITVRLACRGTTPWAVYVPVRIEVESFVAVAARNLRRGEVLTEDDLKLVPMAAGRAGLGYVDEVDRALGKALTRPLRSGQAVRLSHLELAKVVAKGDKVILEARRGSLAVVTSGTALAEGVMGQQIAVRNLKSERIVDAVVVGPGRAQVAF